MDFYKTLEEKELLSVLKREEYKTPSYVGWEKVKDFLVDIVENNRSVYIEGDYDVDGLMCFLCLKDGLARLGVKDIGIYNYRKRSHNVDKMAINECIQKHYDYFIVADTGSSDLGILKLLPKYGTKVIILDHHETELGYDDYPEDFAIINTTIENKLGGDFKLSAGALCFTVMDLLFQELGYQTPKDLSAYATTSLFSDVMDMFHPLNRAIYYVSDDLTTEELPNALTYFLGEYNRFNARYIGYWFSPRINACFRAEEFKYLNTLFLQDSSSVEKSSCISSIESVYENARTMIAKASDIIEVSELNNFVIADIATVDNYINVYMNKLWNYTGLIANQLCEKYKKTAIVICRTDEENIKGSVRDLFGRNYLTIFKQLCFAAGHNPAFGIKIPALGFNEFLADVVRVDEKFSIQHLENEPIIIDWQYQSPDEPLLHDIARYNEFAGPSVPIVLVKKQIIGSIREKHSKYGFKYEWDNLEIQSDFKVRFGQYVLLKPFFSWKMKLQVQS